MLRNILKFLFFLSLGSVILWLVYRQQNIAFQAQCHLDGTPEDKCSLIKKIISDFANVNYFWIFCVAASMVLSNVSRALRWNMLLRPLGYKPSFQNSFWTICLGYFANLGIPRMGEFVRVGSMSRYEEIPFEKVMGTVVVDRLVDFLCLLCVVGLSFIFEYETLWSWLNANIGNKNEQQSLLANPLVLGFLLFCLFFVIALFIFRKKIQKTTIFQKLKSVLKGFGEGLSTIGKVDNLPLFIFHSIAIWFLYYMMAYFCFYAYAPTAHLSLGAALMVFVFGAFGVVIPSPGGMGTYHLLVIGALSLYGISGSDSFAFANIFFFSNMLFGNIIWGIMALIILPIINKKNLSTP